jgi:signal transduction histidine kinase
VVLVVEDQGPGIAFAERDRIFEPFRTTGGSSSTGVGLAICRAVVEAHGGSITVDDRPGGGARFLVSLPVRDG